MREDEMVGWHHQLHGHEFEQAPGVGDGQGSMACCRLWGRTESDTTEVTQQQCISYFFFSPFQDFEKIMHSWAI